MPDDEYQEPTLRAQLTADDAIAVWDVTGEDAHEVLLAAAVLAEHGPFSPRELTFTVAPVSSLASSHPGVQQLARALGTLDAACTSLDKAWAQVVDEDTPVDNLRVHDGIGEARELLDEVLGILDPMRPSRDVHANLARHADDVVDAEILDEARSRG